MMADRIVVPFIAAREGDGRLQAQIVGRALARAGFGNLAYATRIRRKWDARLTSLLRDFELAHGIHHGIPTKAYTRATHAKLARYYDRYNLRLVADLQAQTKTDRVRGRVVAELMYLYNRRATIAYSQARPYDRRKPPARGDCSGSSAWADEHAGGVPPMGLPWGYGSTRTQLPWLRSKGREIVAGRARMFADVKPGDYIFYGPSASYTTHTGRVVAIDPQTGETRSFQFGRYPAAIREIDYRPDRIAICSLLPR